MFKRKFDVPGPDQLNRCEVAAESSLLTRSHLYKSRFAFQWPFRVSCSQERAVISVIIYSLNCRESTPSTFAVCPFLDVVAVVVSLSWSAYFPLSSSFCLTRQDKVLEAVIQVQVASDQSWLVMLSRPGRSGGDEPGFIVIEVGNHERRTLNIRLSSGTSAGSFAVFAGPLINYRTQAGTKKEQIQKKGWKMGFHVSVLRSCEFPFQEVQVHPWAYVIRESCTSNAVTGAYVQRSVQSHLFWSPIGARNLKMPVWARNLKMPVPYSPPNWTQRESYARSSDVFGFMGLYPRAPCLIVTDP